MRAIPTPADREKMGTGIPAGGKSRSPAIRKARQPSSRARAGPGAPPVGQIGEHSSPAFSVKQKGRPHPLPKGRRLTPRPPSLQLSCLGV